MSNELYKDLGKLLQENPDLQKAALSGVMKAIENEIKLKNIKVDPELMKTIGEMPNIDPTGQLATDYVVRGIERILALVQVRVHDPNMSEKNDLKLTLDNQIIREEDVLGRGIDDGITRAEDILRHGIDNEIIRGRDIIRPE